MNSLGALSAPFPLKIATAAVVLIVFDSFYAIDTFTRPKLSSHPQTIVGKVVDEAGRPVDGATITLLGSDEATHTEDNGVFSLTGMSSPESPVVVRAVKNGYDPVVELGKGELSIVLKTSK